MENCRRDGDTAKIEPYPLMLGPAVGRDINEGCTSLEHSKKTTPPKKKPKQTKRNASSLKGN